MNENRLPPENGAAKIIKRRNQKTASVVFGNLIKHQILNAEQQARAILQSAQARADDLVGGAEAEAEEIRRASYRAGREEAESELVENLLAIREERSQALAGVEQNVLKLAVRLAEKIIGREVERDEAARAEMVFSAVRQARQQEMLTVRVSARDLPLVEEMRERVERFGRAQYVDFVADQAVAQGGCIIESASGTIDARLETQLRILENALLARASEETRGD